MSPVKLYYGQSLCFCFFHLYLSVFIVFVVYSSNNKLVNAVKQKIKLNSHELMAVFIHFSDKVFEEVLFIWLSSFGIAGLAMSSPLVLCIDSDI